METVVEDAIYASPSLVTLVTHEQLKYAYVRVKGIEWVPHVYWRSDNPTGVDNPFYEVDPSGQAKTKLATEAGRTFVLLH